MPTSFRRRWLLVTLIGLALIVGSSIFIGRQLGDSQQATLGQARVAADHAGVAALRTSALNSCQRGNQQRLAINKSTGGIYAAFHINAQLELGLVKAGKDKKRKRLEENAGQAILHAASTLQYLPLTDCTQSVIHPASYKLAYPIPYAQYLATRTAHP